MDEHKYIRGVKGRGYDVMIALMDNGAKNVSEKDRELFSNPDYLFYVKDSDIVCVAENSEHGVLLKDVYSEEFLGVEYNFCFTEKQRDALRAAAEFINEKYKYYIPSDVLNHISCDLRNLKHLIRCTECKHFANGECGEDYYLSASESKGGYHTCRSYAPLSNLQ